MWYDFGTHNRPRGTSMEVPLNRSNYSVSHPLKGFWYSNLPSASFFWEKSENSRACAGKLLAAKKDPH